MPDIKLLKPDDSLVDCARAILKFLNKDTEINVETKQAMANTAMDILQYHLHPVCTIKFDEEESVMENLNMRKKRD